MSDVTRTDNKDVPGKTVREIRVEETETSRRRFFLALVRKHFPNAIDYYGRHDLDIGKKAGFWSRFLDKPIEIIFSVINNEVPTYLSGPPFEDGWTNITIAVCRSDYFDRVMAVAKDYGRAVGKDVVIEKKF
ncbi:MAG: hypothetical protein ABSF47_02870 [Minisyncoccia bacterium]|jgi:hypothetical protein